MLRGDVSCRNRAPRTGPGDSIALYVNSPHPPASRHRRHRRGGRRRPNATPCTHRQGDRPTVLARVEKVRSLNHGERAYTIATVARETAMTPVAARAEPARRRKGRWVTTRTSIENASPGIPPRPLNHFDPTRDVHAPNGARPSRWTSAVGSADGYSRPAASRSNVLCSWLTDTIWGKCSGYRQSFACTACEGVLPATRHLRCANVEQLPATPAVPGCRAALLRPRDNPMHDRPRRWCGPNTPTAAQLRHGHLDQEAGTPQRTRPPQLKNNQPTPAASPTWCTSTIVIRSGGTRARE